MFYYLISILGILLTIFFVIGTHEAAHFYMARLLGVKVLRFSIGFGKTLFQWRDKKETEYVFALVPLGGYVRMLDETEGEVPEAEKHMAYNRQPFYKKFLIVLAGPLANIFCAFLLYWLIFVVGYVTVKPVIGQIKPQSIAAASGLKPEQQIHSLDGRDTSTWTNVMFRLLTHLGDRDRLTMVVSDLKPNSPKQTHVIDLTNWHVDELTPDPIGSLGIIPYEPQIPLIIGIIVADSPAYASPLKLGDEILSVNGQVITHWNTLISYVSEHPGEKASFKIKRQHKILTVPVEIGSQRNIFFQKSGYLGIAPKFEWPKEMLHKVQYSPVKALTRAKQEIFDFTHFNLLLFGKMLTGKLSMQSLGGPITIFESAGVALNYGFLSFIAFLAFLSISIGIINLLPIPGLDGGHLFLQIVEVIIRRPIPIQVLNLLLRLGFIFLIVILFQALINDILRLY